MNASSKNTGLLFVSTVLMSTLLVLPVRAQGDDEKKKKDNDPEIKSTIALLEKSYKDKKDDVARSQMRDLLEKSEEAGPKDLVKIAKSFEKAFRQRRQDEEKALYVGAVAALGALGPAGARPLQATFKNKMFKKDPEMLKMVALEIGRTGDKSAISYLTDLLDFKFYEVIAGSAQGLGFFEAAPLKVRKEIVKKLVKTLESADNAARVPNDNEAKRKYSIIGGPLIDSLQKLTRQDLRQPLDWTKWWNENKKAKDW